MQLSARERPAHIKPVLFSEWFDMLDSMTDTVAALPKAATREDRALQAEQQFFTGAQVSHAWQKRIHSSLQMDRMRDMALARDIAYLGDTPEQQRRILDAYEVDQDWFDAKMEDAQFREIIHKFRVDMMRDAGGPRRVLAQYYLEAELDQLHEIVTDPAQKAIDRVRAMNLMAELADAKPKSAEGGKGLGNGVSVTFNFGNDHPHKEALAHVVTGEYERVE